ncbi:MAG TPA: polysaccharide pyruvyl transferase family protein [Prolixibacteraceae bacterium]|nr:polysaccharide pyruvyl transferase family protein [Prolixibacteraceae bacterium]
MAIQTRRNFLKDTGLLSAGLLLGNALVGSTIKPDSTLLLVSGWQDVNIGDIAHTPGLLHVLETFLPDATIILWKKSNATEDVKRLLSSNFPKVKVVYGAVDQSKNVSSPEVIDAFGRADLMIHGSGPSLVGADHLACWTKHTGKPFGVFGTTLQNPDEYHTAILKKASFIFTRETMSITHLKRAGLEGPHIRFAPDATFYLNIHDQEKAGAFLRSAGLENKKFICAIPRLRYTPYHKMGRASWSQEKIKTVEETNQRYKEIDHAKLRDAMISWVRETGNKVLVCPEMTYEVDIMDELLIHPLPDDVKPFVVKRGYWLPDEAASVYASAHTVLSFECHSPIIAAANGTPFMYLRQPEDTIKGQMYADLGFDDWCFEIDNTTGKMVSDRLREIWKDYPKAKSKLAASMDHVTEIYREGCNFIRSV